MTRKPLIFRRFSLLPRRNSRLWTVGRLVLMAGAVGAAAGIGAIVFHWMCAAVAHGVLASLAGYKEILPAGEVTPGGKHLLDWILSHTSQPHRPWVLLLAPGAGGLLAGLLVYRLAPEAEGPGTGAAIDAYHNRAGHLGGRVGMVKILASAITLGTGGSGGREGPIALVGASFAARLAKVFQLSSRERRLLLVAGMGAGIGAFFRAPLAGAIFAVEVLYADPDFEAAALIPAFFATTVAYCVFSLAVGVDPVFTVAPMTRFHQPLLLLPLTVLTVLMVLLSLVYVRCLEGVRWAFGRLAIPSYYKPALGGLGVGIVAVSLYYLMRPLGKDAQRHSLSVLSYGYDFLQELLTQRSTGMAVGLLAAVALGKIVTTSLTIGSGGSAGVFGPSVVIGGAFGAIVGLAFQRWMPSVAARIDVFVILGAAGFFAAAANTPVSTLIMVAEMTGSFALLLPSMWVCGLAYLLSRGWSLYREQVPSRADSPAHRGELIVDVLADMTVRDVQPDGGEEVLTIPKDMLLSEVAARVTETRQTCFPVVDADGRMCGYFSVSDIRYYLYDRVAGELATAGELAAGDVPILTSRRALATVMGLFAQTSYDALPIGADDDPRRIVGLLARRDVVAIYEKALAARRQ